MLQLPDLVLFEQYHGRWEDYLPVLYGHFVQDFVTAPPQFGGVRFALKRHPMIQGKEATFWHFISEGEDEASRIPDMRRCERICWIKPIIENANHSDIRMWEEDGRSNEKRIHLATSDWSYLVVLAHRGSYVLPWTAFFIDKEHRKKKLEKRYNDYIAKTAR